MIAPLLLTVLLAGDAGARPDPQRPNPNRSDLDRLRSEAIVVQAAEVRVGDGTVFKPGVVVLQEGRIAAVGQAPPLPSGSRTIDCSKQIVTAGLVDAACQLGTCQRFGYAEQSSEVIPAFDAADSIDFFSKDLDELIRDGVTTIYVTGEASSVISSRGTAVKTGGPIAQRRLAATPCVKVTLSGESSRRATFNTPPFRGGDVTFSVRRPTTRMGSAWVFREAFHDALRFKETGKTSGDPAQMRALLDVMEGKVKLRFQAREAADIRSAQRDCDEFGLTFVLEYGNETGECLDLVTSRKIPVIFGPPRDGDSQASQFDDPITAWQTPKLLAERGVPFCLTAADASGEGGLSRQAGFAIKNGLDRARALRAVTTDAAAMIGLDKRIGRLAEGFDADLVVWSGEPFDDVSRPVLVVINGRPVLDVEGRFAKEKS
jgi:imidazolonepropionase-like amidohydrolase